MPTVTYAHLLRSNVPFRRLWLGQVVSELGTWFAFIAELGLVRALSGTALSASLIVAAHFLPYCIVGPFAGAIADLLRKHRVDGVIATNTTVSRVGVDGLPNAEQAGGLSGAPVLAKSTAVLGKLAASLAGELPIIGVGGILRGADAAAKIAAGASLVQFYTGFIYRGPQLVAEAAAAIAAQRHA